MEGKTTKSMKGRGRPNKAEPTQMNADVPRRQGRPRKVVQPAAKPTFNTIYFRRRGRPRKFVQPAAEPTSNSTALPGCSVPGRSSDAAPSDRHCQTIYDAAAVAAVAREAFHAAFDSANIAGAPDTTSAGAVSSAAANLDAAIETLCDAARASRIPQNCNASGYRSAAPETGCLFQTAATPMPTARSMVHEVRKRWRLCGCPYCLAHEVIATSQIETRRCDGPLMPHRSDEKPDSETDQEQGETESA